MRWFTTTNEDTMYLPCLKIKISKMLPLQYIEFSAHKSNDALVILNELHRDGKEWCKKEKYGENEERNVAFWGTKRLNLKKTSVRKGFNGGNGVEIK
jgi:hypothetical protein